ncbi:MAG: dihydropteroate synthase [Planctomycetota bacterium]
MGVLNVTPDSFSDGGKYGGVAEAAQAGFEMARAGAAVIDIGGESTRPGAERVSAAEQVARVVPVVERLRALLDADDSAGVRAAVMSVDTTSAEVAAAALGAGASVINDVSAGREDPGMLGLAAERGCPVVLMHMRGQPSTMQAEPRYDDVVGELEGFLLERAAAAEAAGVARGQIAIDPGIGFGKTLDHNLALLRGVDRLAGHGYPVVVGVSRKRMIPAITGRGESAGDRLGGSIAGALDAARRGAVLLRVHDVAASRQALDVFGALLGWGDGRGSD